MRAVAEARRVGPVVGLARIRAVVSARDVQLGVVGLDPGVEDRDVDVGIARRAVGVVRRADAPNARLDLSVGRWIWIARGMDGHVGHDRRDPWIGSERPALSGCELGSKSVDDRVEASADRGAPARLDHADQIGLGFPGLDLHDPTARQLRRRLGAKDRRNARRPDKAEPLRRRS